MQVVTWTFHRFLRRRTTDYKWVFNASGYPTNAFRTCFVIFLFNDVGESFRFEFIQLVQLIRYFSGLYHISIISALPRGYLLKRY